jgi:hypothetical protein
MMEEFDDFREDVEAIAEQREQMRLDKIDEKSDDAKSSVDEETKRKVKMEQLEQMEKLIE